MTSIFNNAYNQITEAKPERMPIYLNEWDPEANSASFWSYKQIGSESVFMHIKCLVYVFPTLAPSKTGFSEIRIQENIQWLTIKQVWGNPRHPIEFETKYQ